MKNKKSKKIIIDFKIIKPIEMDVLIKKAKINSEKRVDLK